MQFGSTGKVTFGSNMKWTNFHNHSQYDDGKNTIEEHVLGAIEQNVMSLGFSGHCPVSFENHWCMKIEDLDQYIHDIEEARKKYRGQIQVYKSMEIDYIPGIISPGDQWIADLNLDYIIGSVHFAGFYEDGSPGEVDSTHRKFIHGLEHIFHGDAKSLVSEYFRLNRTMVRDSKLDVVGHVDKIKMQNRGLWDETSKWYQTEVLSTLEEIKAARVIVEINTRGLYKKLTTETYPSSWILKHILQMDIPVHINSDAHIPREITNNFAEALQLISSIGFRKVNVLMDGEWRFVEIGKNGLKM